jgi:hypothetical protein
LRGRARWLRRRRSGRRGLLRRAELLARRIADPGSGINVPDDREPFLGFGRRVEITHVQPEALASILEAAADEERETRELGGSRLLERHRRRGRGEIDDERPGRGLARARAGGPRIPRRGARLFGHCLLSPENRRTPRRNRKPPEETRWGGTGRVNAPAATPLS